MKKLKNSEIFNKYIKVCEENPEKYYKDYLACKEKVANSTAIYKGEPIPFLYNPMFHTEKDVENFKYIIDTLMKILNKVIGKYLNDSDYREKFGFSKELEELILIDPGYDVSVPIGRFDVFYKDINNFKFCELNADGASAMNEDNVIDRIILETEAIKNLSNEYQFDYLKLVDEWVEESIKLYKKFNSINDKPNVAIVDFKGLGTVKEFEVFKKVYEEHGYNAEIVDPRELIYKNNSLYYNDFKVDMIYRRAVTCELMERISEIPDFIEAYKDKNVCFIGGIRSQIAHNKIIFKVLHDKDTLELLSEEERKYVKNHIPYTAEFENNISIKEEAKNKDKYVLKPKDLYASKGVYVGKDFSIEEWNKKIEECWNNEYLLQEFCVPYTKEMVRFEEDKMTVEKFMYLIGLFQYNEKFRGFYTRVGKNNIISTSTGGFTVPNIVVKEKYK